MQRHVSKLLLLVPAGEKEQGVKGNVGEQDNVILEDDVEVERTIFVEEDVCKAMAPSVSSSYNSPDARKQDEVEVLQAGEVDEEPRGNVSASHCNPRFGHTCLQDLYDKLMAHLRHTISEKAHQGAHQLSQVGKPNLT